jgi:hypothetical protein
MMMVIWISDVFYLVECVVFLTTCTKITDITPIKTLGLSRYPLSKTYPFGVPVDSLYTVSGGDIRG